MAADKNGFILYKDLIHTVEKLPDEKVGQLFKTILEYVNDLDPEPDDILIQVIFEPIKQQLKRDLQAWRSIREKRADAGSTGGKKSGEIRKKKAEIKRSKTKQNEANPSVAGLLHDEKEEVKKDAKQTGDNNMINRSIEANEAVNVTVTDTVIHKYNEESKNTDQQQPSTNPLSLQQQPVAPPAAEVWNTKPGPEQHGLELPPIKIGAIRELLLIGKAISATDDQIRVLWAVFKVQNLNGVKYYQHRSDVEAHFFNWCRYQQVAEINKNITPAASLEERRMQQQQENERRRQQQG